MILVRSAVIRRSSNANDSIDEADSPTEALEQGTLSINTENKEVWQRPSRRPLPDDGNIVLRFEIMFARIMPREGDTINANTSTKKYVIYEVSVRQDSAENDPHPTTIERRYTHFLNLYESLKKAHPDLMQNVTFPKKVLIGNFSTDVIAERSAAFEAFLDYIITKNLLKEHASFIQFLQCDELTRACQLLDERRNEQAIPILENCFRLLNKVYLDRSKPVLLLLCRLVAACTTSPLPHPMAEQWAELAIRRYESVCDTDLLVLYIPLLQTCVHLWWQRGRDNKLLEERLSDMGKRGIPVKGNPTLTQALHDLDPRAETT